VTRESRPSEQLVEEVALVHFQEAGIRVRHGAELDDAGERIDHREIFLRERLLEALRRLNPALPHDAHDQVVRELRRSPHPTLAQGNRWFHTMLTEGLEIEYADAVRGGTRGGRARLIDFADPLNNDFLVVRQLTVAEPSGRLIRPDLTVFVNGMPLVVVELKNPAESARSLDVAIDQLRRYATMAPNLFLPNLLLVASDGLLTRVGPVAGANSRFTPWRSTSYGEPTLRTVIHGLLEPSLLIDYIRTCVVFEENVRGEVAKKIAGYHQFRAVRSTRERVLDRLKAPLGEGDGRGGVVWHTQGSGKSLTMLMLAGALIREPALENPTLVMITDRADLDDQLFDTFASGRQLLGETPIHAESRQHLRAVLDRAAGGVLFTTMQKFTGGDGAISERANVVVIADEAHRSQYGFVAGGARWMREALPNATFVGFTGTPIEHDDRNTTRVFGEYSDVYDMRQAVGDGATTPLYYESRVIELAVDEVGEAEAEAELRLLTAADALGEEAPGAIRIPLEALVGAPERLERLAAFIVEHWEKRRDAMEGKAMVVTMSRDIAARLYDAIRAVRPEWHDPDDDRGVMKVVVSGSGDESEPLRSHVRSGAARRRLAERFKNPDDDFRLVIVCEMWLTGFDCPSAHTMYLDKPLARHNLMQAVARVNRVFGDKPGGLIVDLLGLADQLADALAMYTEAGGGGRGVQQAQDAAVPAMQEAFEKLRAFFHGSGYVAALGAQPQEVLPVYLSMVDHVFAQPDGWQRLQALVKQLSVAFALAVPRPETDALVEHLAIFQRVAAMIRKRLAEDSQAGGAGSQRDVDLAVRQVVGGAVDAGEVIDLFAAAGLDTVSIDILSDEFLRRVAALEQKNLALETLRKLLNDQIRVSERTNVVQSGKFREALRETMTEYTNKAITTAEVIVRLIELARHLREAERHGEVLGLSTEETAFYDALAENGSARDLMANDTLRVMARELSEIVKNMPKLDWTERESVRAGLRRSVRRLLARYGYPPDLADNATQLVLRQAELSTTASLDGVREPWQIHQARPPFAPPREGD
jgi:type I restriction enzyme, R subunit